MRDGLGAAAMERPPVHRPNPLSYRRTNRIFYGDMLSRFTGLMAALTIVKPSQKD
jgi:hypothetical protein